MAPFFPLDALQENKILTRDIQLSKPFIQVFPTKKSEIIYSTLCSLVQVWASVTETDSDVTTQNMTIQYVQWTSQSFVTLPCNYSFDSLSRTFTRTNLSAHTYTYSFTLRLTEGIYH